MEWVDGSKEKVFHGRRLQVGNKSANKNGIHELPQKRKSFPIQINFGMKCNKIMFFCRRT